MKKFSEMKMGKVKRWLIAIVLLVGFCTIFTLIWNSGYAEMPEQFDETAVIEEAKVALGYFNEREYQKIIDMSEGGMDNYITAEEIAAQCDPLLDEAGSFVDYKKIETAGTTDEAGDEYAGVIMTVKYEHDKLKFIVAFDEDMKLAQFQVQ